MRWTRMLLPVVACCVLVGGCSDPEPRKDGKAKEVEEDKKEAYELPYPQDGKDPLVVMTFKDYGDVKIQLFAAKAPITTKNFLKYVDDKHYDGTIFHRVMPDFMIQGGHFTKGFAKANSYEQAESLGKKTRGNIKNESTNGLSNRRGTLAMARQNAPHTASDQFFINVVDNTSKLDPGMFSPDGYAVFGQVSDGMDFVDRIKKVKTMRKSPAGHEAVPIEDVIITSVRREESK